MYMIHSGGRQIEMAQRPDICACVYMCISGYESSSTISRKNSVLLL